MNCQTGCDTIHETCTNTLERAYAKGAVVSVRRINAAGYVYTQEFVSLVDNNTDYPPAGAGRNSPTWKLKGSVTQTGQEADAAPTVTATATACGHTIAIGDETFEHEPSKYIPRSADTLKVWDSKFSTGLGNTQEVNQTNPHVADSTVLTRADFPGLPDCHNAVLLSVNLGLNLNPNAAGLEELISYTDVQGASLFTDGSLLTSYGEYNTGGYKSTVTVPFKADGTLDLEHRIAKFPATSAVTHAQSHMAVKYLGSSFVTF